MSIMEFANGLMGHPAYKRSRVAIFFDNDHGLLEEPTRWMMAVAKRKSRSIETSRNYAHILARYFDWLDCEGYGCVAWQSIDEDIFDAYLVHLAQPRQDGSTIAYDTALHYAYRIYDFYSWAKKSGYEHSLEVERDEIEHRLDANQHLLGHIKPSVSVGKLNFNLPTGRPALHYRELDRFVTQSDYEAALPLFDDPVYAIIATIIRITAVRPKDLLQLPYRGKEVNVDFVPYDEGEAPPDLGRRSLHYEFASKGKVRSIEFPGKLWQAICAAYIPLRRQRAALYRQRTGISPPNSVLFLNEAGYAVTYQMLYREFAKIPFLAAKALDVKFKGRRFTACMIRHSCATYFVYEALKQKGRLGQHFVYDAALDEELRKLMGHKDIKTTLEYYVHLVNRFVHDDLLVDLKRAQVDSCLSALLEHHDYGGS